MPTAQSPPVVSVLLWALSIASRKSQKPLPDVVAESARLLTVIVLARRVQPGLGQNNGNRQDYGEQNDDELQRGASRRRTPYPGEGSMADRTNAEIKRAHLASLAVRQSVSEVEYTTSGITRHCRVNQTSARFLQQQQLRIITLLLCLTLTLIGSVNLDSAVELYAVACDVDRVRISRVRKSAEIVRQSAAVRHDLGLHLWPKSRPPAIAGEKRLRKKQEARARWRQDRTYCYDCSP